VSKLVIITDLDGTLLHPRTYSFDEAAPALALIKRLSIPLVLSSSKTRAEILLYRERLGNHDPFISENGGGVFIPVGYFPGDTGGTERGGYSIITMGRPYDEIRGIFKEIKDTLSISAPGFGDMSAEEIAALTGLGIVEARLAKLRDFDEPFVVDEGDAERTGELLGAIEKAGLGWTRGRLYHILGDNDKGRAAEVLKGLFRKTLGSDIKTIGVGDSLNDLPLLRTVDYPVLVQRADGGYDDEVEVDGLIKANGVGPAGWNKAVLEIIDG
jgi:mannosyl-3-phosphoglycerate phosphatase